MSVPGGTLAKAEASGGVPTVHKPNESQMINVCVIDALQLNIEQRENAVKEARNRIGSKSLSFSMRCGKLFMRLSSDEADLAEKAKAAVLEVSGINCIMELES